MKNKILIAVVVVLGVYIIFLSYLYYERVSADIAKQEKIRNGLFEVVEMNQGEFKIICLDGIEYFYKDEGDKSALSPHFKPNGTLYTCPR